MKFLTKIEGLDVSSIYWMKYNNFTDWGTSGTGLEVNPLDGEFNPIEEVISQIESRGYQYGKDIIAVRIKITPLRDNGTCFAIMDLADCTDMIEAEIVIRTATSEKVRDPAWEYYGEAGIIHLVHSSGEIQDIKSPTTIPQRFMFGYISSISVVLDDGTLRNAIETGLFKPYGLF